MATSRYSYSKTISEIIDYNPFSKLTRLATFPPVNQNELMSEDDVLYELKDGDRIDGLADKYYGDGRYWWIICMINGISVPFGQEIRPGKIIRIPVSIDRALEVLRLKANRKD